MRITRYIGPGASVTGDLDLRKIFIERGSDGYGLRGLSTHVLEGYLLEDIYTYAAGGDDSVYTIADKLEAQYSPIEFIDTSAENVTPQRILVYEITEKDRQHVIPCVYGGSRYLGVLKGGNDTLIEEMTEQLDRIVKGDHL